MAVKRSSLSPEWKSFYNAAILESDASKLLRRISLAENAIRRRLEDLNADGDSKGSERQALGNALILLYYLRRLSEEGEGPSLAA